MRIRKVTTAAALCGVVALSTSACLSGGNSGGSGSGGGDSSGSSSAKTNISLMFAFTGDQAKAFEDELTAWGAKQSPALTFKYNASSDFQTQITTAVKSGSTPDIAIFPQPGILKTLAKQGKVAELSTQTDVDKIKSDDVKGILDAGTVDGKVYGAPIGFNVKGLYWYPKQLWQQKGWTPPKTEAELEAFFAKVKASGIAPLCYGMESGSATGWPGTDWIEDYVLQTGGTDVYDKWVAGQTKFDSPEIKKAFDIYTKLVMTPGYTLGGPKGAASTSFQTALNPMFQGKCALGFQGSFITQSGFFPKDVAANLDKEVGVFKTPSVNGQNPVEGGGDLAAAMTKNDSNVKKVIDYITNSSEWGTAQAKTGAYLSPHKSFDVKNYPSDTLREVVKIAFDADVFRFDGSDQMPGAVGSKSFWTGMVNYTTGQTDLDTTLKAIDDTWPAS